MSAKASTLKSSIEAEMEQNLVKEAIHLHLLSAMSEAGILRHAVFQGGSALRLCYGGERYSEDLAFVCGKSGSYFTDVEFKELIETALETTKKTLSRDFGIDSNQISLKKPEHPDRMKQSAINVAVWQIIVPVEATRNAPKSRSKIEFANVPAYATKPCRCVPRRDWCRSKT
jgi:predicted nucleotidyltransferase component of viral defense system